MTKTEVEKQFRALPKEEQLELVYSVLKNALPPVTEEEKEMLERRW